eukprot:scaffold74210_cov78-Phaeocystis_antarctica.AAC.1
MARSERRQRGGRFGVAMAKVSVKHVVRVRCFHQVVDANKVRVYVELGGSRAQVGHAKASEHAVHGPVAHVRGVQVVVAEVELFQTEETLRFVWTARHVDQPRKALESQTHGSTQCSIPCPREGPGA